jgi:formylglycine-generating enzyme required for sulfatase activity
MVHVRGPLTLTMGSAPPLTPDENERAVRIDRSFALSAREVSVDEFLRYNPGLEFDRDVYAGDDGPITKVSWYEAAKYCRWLSEQEGVPESQMCYPEVDEIGPAMRLPADFLERTGYRLPTEAEWEYAARAGTSTPYFFGENPRSLRSYGWYSDNSDFRVWPGGLLKPNPLGLFDVYGNVREWCHDLFEPGPDDPNALTPSDGKRVTRGGGYRAAPLGARSALREGSAPKTRFSEFGLRVARTLPK